MVASEGPNAFDRRGSYSYDATSSRTLRVYDTGKPETYSTWWATHGQAALDSEGLLFAVLNGPPTYDDAATEAIEREKSCTASPTTHGQQRTTSSLR